MKALLELQKQMEIDFLKEYSYEQINDMFRELKTKLDDAESKVKNLGLFSVSQQRELLLAFFNWVDKENYSFDIAETQPEFIERFLKANNCG